MDNLLQTEADEEWNKEGEEERRQHDEEEDDILKAPSPHSRAWPRSVATGYFALSFTLSHFRHRRPALYARQLWHRNAATALAQRRT